MVEDFTKKFEHTVATFYSEFNKKTELKNWGIAEYEGKNIEFYTNPDFIKEYFTEPIAKHLEKNNISKNANLNLADFGGGDGVLIKELITQLNKIGYKNINGVNIDYTYKNLEKMDKNDDCKIIGIQGDTDQLPLKDNSVDIGVSRHLIQYFSKEKQPEILQNISNTLKPNSIFIMKWPGSDNPEQSPILTDFYAKLFGICVNRLSDKVAKNKYFVSYQEVEETAKKIGLKIINSGKCNAKLSITAEAFSDRFNLSEDQRKKINKVFEEFFNAYSNKTNKLELIKDNDGVIHSIQRHNFIVFKK